LGWNTPIKEADLWRFVVQEFAVDLWTMAPTSGIADPGIHEFPTIEAILDEYRGTYTPVFVDESAEEDLETFQHPESAIYVFGRVGSAPYRTDRTELDRAVRVRTPTDSGLLWPHQIAAILLHDRNTKWR
jgi:hypothetical protein